MKQFTKGYAPFRRWAWLLGLLVIIGLGMVAIPSLTPPTQARSSYLAMAQAHYPAIVDTRLDSCNLCHTSSLPTLNNYGQAYRDNGHNFTAIESQDSDADGYSNLIEITALSFPGDAGDTPASPPDPPPSGLTYYTFLPIVSHNSGDDGNDPGPGPVPGQYVIIGWNDLGMHCMDPSFEDFAVLPPFNTLWAQVIQRAEEPRIVTQGVTVEYRIIDNTYSVGKTNFWDYAQQLFDLPQPLPLNVGLAGFGLSGQMHADGNHFAAEGIPLTEFRDSDLNTPYPYQLAELVARDSAGNVLATTQTVAPVSTEMNCQVCHADNGPANPNIATGVMKQNILSLHDQREHTDLMANRPVLCARCHGSNALGTPGAPGLPSLSLAMHGEHQSVTDDCYLCHPGPQTKCLRGTMAQEGMTCQDCHGHMSDVADPTRQPWLDEPRCGTCHGPAHSEEPGKLYRFSTGHGGVYCQACHGSQHAIYPTNQPNDNLQSIMLQGKPGTIKKCTVCHTTTPDGAGPHSKDGDDGDDD
ncbi:MAG: hypothetical protein Kow0063_05590 [Anaerolineae bacterium]